MTKDADFPGSHVLHTRPASRNMRWPRMTIRRWMAVVAVMATVFGLAANFPVWCAKVVFGLLLIAIWISPMILLEYGCIKFLEWIDRIGTPRGGGSEAAGPRHADRFDRRDRDRE